MEVINLNESLESERHEEDLGRHQFSDVVMRYYIRNRRWLEWCIAISLAILYLICFETMLYYGLMGVNYLLTALSKSFTITITTITLITTHSG